MHTRAAAAAKGLERAEARGEGPRPLTADEARAAAAAEGLELVPSASGQTGFKGVNKSGGRYAVSIKENGKSRHLGTFATPEEAALCYARHAGAERAAAEAVEARVEKPQPLTADETGLANGLRRSADGRVWNALGTQLCAKDGCTKPAWHSGICVSVLGYRRDQKRVQKYTAEPALSPRELMRQAREKRRLPPSEKPKLGDRVRGKYQGQIGGRNWIDGVVTAVLEDGTCNLHYDDGDFEERVAPRFIRVIAEEEIEEIEEAEEEAELVEPEEVAVELEEVSVVEEPSEWQGGRRAALKAAHANSGVPPPARFRLDLTGLGRVPA